MKGTGEGTILFCPIRALNLYTFWRLTSHTDNSRLKIRAKKLLSGDEFFFFSIWFENIVTLAQFFKMRDLGK